MSYTYTISAHTLNELGVLSRIALLFNRRRISIQRLQMVPGQQGVMRFDIVVHCHSDTAEKVIRQLYGIVEMLEVSISEGDRIAAPALTDVSRALRKVG